MSIFLPVLTHSTHPLSMPIHPAQPCPKSRLSIQPPPPNRRPLFPFQSRDLLRCALTGRGQPPFSCWSRWGQGVGNPAKLETVVVVAAKERLMRLLDRCDADGCCKSPRKSTSYEKWMKHKRRIGTYASGYSSNRSTQPITECRQRNEVNSLQSSLEPGHGDVPNKWTSK